LGLLTCATFDFWVRTDLRNRNTRLEQALLQERNRNAGTKGGQTTGKHKKSQHSVSSTGGTTVVGSKQLEVIVETTGSGNASKEVSMSKPSSVSTASKWSLKSVLKTDLGYQSFLAYSTREHSQENIMFWKAVSTFESTFASSTDVDQCRLAAEQIVNQFIVPSAPMQINISGNVLAAFMQLWEHSTCKPPPTTDTANELTTTTPVILANIFSNLKRQVLGDLMSLDLFPRYLASQEFEEFQRQESVAVEV